MASPFQTQVRQRKFLYIGLILVLFTLTWGWRQYVINDLAARLAIREQSRGEVELTGAVVRLGLTGSRGLATCILWSNAIDKQKKNQWNELEVLVRSLTKLQPHFITPWLFQSWNLAYNVSVESDRVRDKYFYVTRGIELLAEGERQNSYHPDLRWSIGFYTQHKICQSDETNYQRSLFQLSLIPPNERDPNRFYTLDDKGGREFNWVEFEKFCKDHPQLVRRLKDGMARENRIDRKRQFTCERPQQVVEFLEDNFQVPSLYRSEPLASRVWDPARKNVVLPPETRFPVLPPTRNGVFDPEAITADSQLRDDTDAYAVSHAWYCFAQEALPAPSKTLPGNSEDIVDPARQRRPRHITTLIFRNYPAQGARYMAERLQQEGWYDEEPWDASDWFRNDPDAQKAFPASKEFSYGGGKAWSLDAWKRAHRAWKRHGEENKLLFPSEAEEQNTRSRALAFAKKHRIAPNGSPPPLRDDQLQTPEDRLEYEAARFMFEFEFYRRVSNFPHHYNRTLVEQREETVACRKAFYQADQLDLAGFPRDALERYGKQVSVPGIDGWKDRKLSPMEAWRDLVLLKNPEFLADSIVQEQTVEVEIRYLDLLDRNDGPRIKKELSALAPLLPMVPRFDPEVFRRSIFQGPFTRKTESGMLVPMISDDTRYNVLERLGLFTRPRETPPPGTPGPDSPPPDRGGRIQIDGPKPPAGGGKMPSGEKAPPGNKPPQGSRALPKD
ncbi:MAG: hypothetical protein U0840_20980 [Gemmataceae bacterium]